MIVKTPAGRYRARVKFRGVVVADRTFEKRADAARWETEQRRLLNEGDYIPPSSGRIVIKDLAEEYRESRLGQVAVRSWESDESALRVHIVPAFGKLPVSSVTPIQIERFLTDLATRRSVRTAARVRTTPRGLFEYAVRTRRIRRSPAADVRLPRTDSRTGKVVEFEPYTLDLLLDVVESQRPTAGRYADVTLVLGLTGLRMAELRGLRVRDITDVPYPALIVKRSLPESARTGRVVERTTTKSGRRRVVPLSELVQPVIARWAQGKDAEDLLFPSPEGAYLRSNNWRRMTRWEKTSLGRRPHDLRHTAASLWIAAGVDIKTIASWLGHSTAALTLDTYGHLMGTDADRAALDRVNRVFGAASGPRSANSLAVSEAEIGETGR